MKHNRSVDAGFFEPVSIGDRTWIDLNGNGIQDINETNLSGVKVELMDAGCQTLISHDQNNSAEFNNRQITDINGSYLFTNLKPDLYCLQFTAPSGYVITLENNGSDDTNDSDINSTGSSIGQTAVDYNLTSGEHNRSVDAGFFEPVSIGDRTWLDLNGNGIQDINETNLSGVKVTLWYDGNDTKVIKDINGVPFGSSGTITTNASGYLFENLRPDNYYIKFIAPNGHVITLENNGTDDTNDSDANGTFTTSGQTEVYELSTGEHNRSVDVGFFQVASIGDRVWVDENGNGIQDNNESNQKDVKVTLHEANGTQVLTDIYGNSLENIKTNSSGEYLFDNLKPGNYYIEFNISNQVDFVFTAKGTGAGVSDPNDSDADSSTGKTDITALESDEHDMGWDAGIYKPATIGNRIWIDTNANGIQESGENSLSGINVDVTLYNGADTKIASTTTSTGGYIFSGLKPDTYYIKFTLPTGYELSPESTTQGLDNDSDVNLATMKTHTTTLVSGETDTTWDMGLYQTATIGNRIWLDTNANGTQDSNESEPATGVSVTVELHYESNGSVAQTKTVTDGSYLIYKRSSK